MSTKSQIFKDINDDNIDHDDDHITPGNNSNSFKQINIHGRNIHASNTTSPNTNNIPVPHAANNNSAVPNTYKNNTAVQNTVSIGHTAIASTLARSNSGARDNPIIHSTNPSGNAPLITSPIAGLIQHGHLGHQYSQKVHQSPHPKTQQQRQLSSVDISLASSASSPKQNPSIVQNGVVPSSAVQGSSSTNPQPRNSHLLHPNSATRHDKQQCHSSHETKNSVHLSSPPIISINNLLHPPSMDNTEPETDGVPNSGQQH